MEQKMLNWGLLSTARINRAVIEPINASERSHLLAVASRNLDSAEVYARQWQIPRFHGSYQSLLNDPEINIIYNSLPNDLHAEWTVKALEAGKNVLCEKPLALSLPEIDRISSAAKANQKIAAEAFMYRHHPKTLKIQQMIKEGLIGTPRLLRGTFSFQLNRPDDIRWNPQQGGGALWDIGCYPLSYARSILGLEPIEVFGWQATSASGVDVSFSALLRFPGDVLVQLDCSFAGNYRTHFEITGSDGILSIPNPYGAGEFDEVYLRRENNHTAETISLPAEELYLGEIQDMENAILDKKPQRLGLADSRANTQAILALLESVQTGKPVLI